MLIEILVEGDNEIDSLILVLGETLADIDVLRLDEIDNDGDRDRDVDIELDGLTDDEGLLDGELDILVEWEPENDSDILSDGDTLDDNE